MTLVYLAIIAVVEAVVHLWRYRTANEPSAFISGASTAMVCMTRVAFLAAGVSAMMQAVPFWEVVAVYVVPATVCTVIAHEIMERRKTR